MTGRKAYADVGIIPLTGEHNMMLQIGNIVFVDSCQFLATTLDNLVKALRKSGVDKFCLLYTSPSPRDRQKSRMPSSA